MSHKVNPKSFRLRKSEDWHSRWMNRKKLPEYLEEDFKIRNFIETKLKEAGVENIEIERFANKISVIINSSRPGLVIGRGGQGAEEIKKGLEKIIPQKEIKIEVREIKRPWTSAALSAQWVAQQLEKRVSHRRAAKQVLEKIMANKEVLGSRIEISGRLGGSEIARREWLKKGNLPRQTLRADIDYALAEAYCNYGTIGIKIWIYKGEKF